MFFDGIFSEWDDNKQVTKAFSLLTIFSFLGLLWIVTNIPAEQIRANIFLWMLIFAVIVQAIDFPETKNEFLSFTFFGKSFSQAALGIGLGVVTAYFILSQGMVLIGAPITTTFAIVSISFVYTCLVAPYVEEFFFRMALYPTANNFLKSTLNNSFMGGALAIILTCGAFAFMHWLAYGANEAAMTSAFVFSLIAITGNKVSQSAGFGFGLHFANNLIIWMAMGGI
jgi:membrane protease YdiL (CAAX protease family)